MEMRYAGFVRVPVRWSRPTTCYVRIYLDPAGVQLPVVIATELGGEDNQGMSITNACEYVAAYIWRTQLSEERRGLILVEHYADHLVGNVPLDRNPRLVAEETKESYARVEMEMGDTSFSLREPEWHPMKKADLEALIGQPLEDLEDLRRQAHRSRDRAGW